MPPEQNQHVIDELQGVIDDIRALMTRFESTGLEHELVDDYSALQNIYRRAVNDQREHTLAMLAGDSTAEPTTER